MTRSRKKWRGKDEGDLVYFGADCRSFAYCSGVSSSQMPPRFFLIASSISWRPEMLRVKPPRFTSSNSFRSSASTTVRGRRVLPVLFHELAEPTLSKAELQEDSFHAHTCAALAKSLASTMRRRKRSLAFAADLPCVSLPNR